jgi:streptogramin lyase
MFTRMFRGSAALQRLLARVARRPGPASSRRRYRLTMESLEDRCLLSGGIIQFPTLTTPSFPLSITSGPDGNLWFTESNGVNQIGTITPAGVVSEHPTGVPASNPIGITGGPFPDTRLWFTAAGGIAGPSAIATIDSKTGVPMTQAITNDDPKNITNFYIPPISIFQLPVDEFWYTDTAGDQLGELVPGQKTPTKVPLPVGSDPWGITTGTDDGIWFTELATDRIGRLDPATHTIQAYALPAGSQPRNITADSDGVWFTEDNGNQIGMLDYKGNYRHWTVPTASSHPWGITVGPDGAIWFTESAGNKVGRLDGSGAILEIDVPSPKSKPLGITGGPDGNIWFTEFSASAIGRIGLDKPLHGIAKTVSTGEAGYFAGVVASFTDDDPLATASSYTAKIDWGNSFTSAGTIVKNGNQFDVVGNSIAYGEEGTYPITVTVTDIDDSHDLGGSTVTVHSTMNVSDSPLVPIGLSFDAGEGQAFSNVPICHFLDTGGAETYTVTIDWGDSTPTSSGLVSLNNGVFLVRGSHTYAEEGGYTIKVTIQDEGGSMTTATSTANVGDAPLAPSAVSLSGSERSPLNGVTVATFTDSGGPEAPGNYTTTINWGDQTPTEPGVVSYSGGVFHVTGSHTYGDEGTYTVTVSILDAEALPYYVFSTAAIADAPLSSQPTTVAPTEGAFFSGKVGSFTDAAGLEGPSAYGVLIDWGDGHQSAGLLQANMTGGYDIVGDHTYAEEGAYPIQVTVQDDGGKSVVVASKATVADAALSAVALNFSGTTGVALTNVLVGIFSDAGGPEVPGNYTVSIDWGDKGPATTGVVTPQGTLFLANGSHTYASAGSYTVTVTVQDEGGDMVTVFATATIKGGKKKMAQPPQHHRRLSKHLP